MLVTKYITLSNYWDVVSKKILAYYQRARNVNNEYYTMIQTGLGNKILDKITVDDLEEWKVNLRKNGFSNEQIAASIGILRKIFHEAKKDRVIDVNPMKDFKGYPTVHRPLFQLTDEQELKLIRAAKDKENRELFLLMLSTGIHWNELAAVRRESLLKRTGYLELTHILLRNDGLQELPSKSSRIIPLGQISRELFRVALLRQDLKEEKMGKNPYDFVFTSQRNKSVAQSFGLQWRVMCKEAGLHNVKPIDLVYNYGIRALRAGANPKTLMHYQGYLREEILDRYYLALESLTDAEKLYGAYYERIMEDGEE